MSKEQEVDQTVDQARILEAWMLSKDYHTTIKELYAAGMSKRGIAGFLGIDTKTVRRHLAKAVWTAYHRLPVSTKLLADHKAWLIERMPEVGYNAVILFRELKVQGYQGSYETVKAFVHPYRGKQAKACVRYETAPGVQSQVDWGSAWVWLGAQETKVHFFTLVLGYSRRLFAQGYQDESFMSLVKGHEAAFRWFGGMTAEILYDNARTMVTRHHAKTKTLVLNHAFEDFAHVYGFMPRFCTPYRPQTKGKIESGVKYLKRNFLPGRRFKDLAHLNHELEAWLLEVADVRCHGTTHERPKDRFLREQLIPVQQVRPYHYVPAIQRKVSQDAMISFHANRYSVPWRYVGQCVDLKITAGQVIISAQGHTIANHTLVHGKHQCSLHKEHYEGLVRSSRRPLVACPKHDPYWQEAAGEVMVRDLVVYEKAAFASTAIH